MDRAIADFQEKNTAFHNGYIKTEGDEQDILGQLSEESRLENIYAQYKLQNISVKVGETNIAIEEKYPMPKATEQMSYGVMPRLGANEISLSPSLAAKFEQNIQNLIGQTAEVTYEDQTYRLTVSGIFNASYDDFFVSSDIEQKFYRGMTEKAYSVSYDVTEFEDIPVLSDTLAEQGILTKDASAEVDAFLNTFRNLNRLFLVISILIFVIGIIISTILLIKQQNTRFREVGLLSALGYMSKSIKQILTGENLLLCAAAAFCNGILTTAAILCGKLFGLPVILSFPQILLSVCLTAIVVLSISGLAGMRLIHIEPAAALRK